MKHFSFKFAKSIIIKILLPIYFILFSVCLILFYFSGELNIKNVLTLFLTLFITFCITFLVFMLLGKILSKNHNLRETEDAFFQKKIMIKKDNIKMIVLYPLKDIFCLEFIPIRNGIFKSSRLIYYFNNLDESLDFIVNHNSMLEYMDNFRKCDLLSLIRDSEGKREEDGLLPREDYIKLIKKYFSKCDCCGCITILEKSQNNICPVCFWEDDDESLYDQNMDSLINHMPLWMARENYKNYGFSDYRFKDHLRKPYSFEKDEK